MQQHFVWDFKTWAQLNDVDTKGMAVLKEADLDQAFPQRVIVIDAISFFGRLLIENPSQSPTVIS